MVSLSFQILLAVFSAVSRLSEAAPDWVSLALSGPNAIMDNTISWFYYVNNVLIGTPPATESLVLDVNSDVFGVSSDDCVFCSGGTLFDPTLSSTYKMTSPSWTINSTDFGGVLAQDTLSFGGILTSKNTPFKLIERMSQNLTLRFGNGVFGLFVSPTNDALRNQHPLTLLHNAGQLLNPVVGLRLGKDVNTSHITIGALDPNDYEGTINWIQTEIPDPTWESPLVIEIDGFRGYNGSFLPYGNSLFSYLNTLNAYIYVPNVWTYMASDNYTGPIKSINFDSIDYGFQCNQTGGAYVAFAVDINGVSYQIDSQDNLLRNISGFSAPGYCNIGIHNATLTTSVQSSLGLPFFRSVYTAYRFPTNDCPNAYIGFAFPKGSNRTSSMIAQRPRVTPVLDAQCLSFTTPTSTPTVATPTPQISAKDGISGTAYNVYGSPDDPQVRLVGVDELPASLVQGPTVAS